MERVNFAAMSHPLLTSLLLAGTLAIAPLAARADAATDALAAPLIARLAKDGYALVETRLSWLGRLVVVTSKDGATREIVLNRTTGAVLSDRQFQTGKATTMGKSASTNASTNAPTNGQAPTQSTAAPAPSASAAQAPGTPTGSPTPSPSSAPRSDGGNNSNANR